MKPLLLCLFIAFSCTAHSQIPAKPSLEELNALMDSSFCEDNTSNTAINDCYTEMGKKYEQILNDNYRQLIKGVSPKYKAYIIESERKWVAYKDAEIKLRQNLPVKHGNPAARLANIFKERAEYIAMLLQSLDY